MYNCTYSPLHLTHWYGTSFLHFTFPHTHVFNKTHIRNVEYFSIIVSNLISFMPQINFIFHRYVLNHVIQWNFIKHHAIWLDWFVKETSLWPESSFNIGVSKARNIFLVFWDMLKYMLISFDEINLSVMTLSGKNKR